MRLTSRSAPPTTSDGTGSVFHRKSEDAATFPVATSAEQSLDRRRFLCAAGSAAVLAVGGEWAARRLGATLAEPATVTLAADAVPAPGEAEVLLATDGREVLVVRPDGAAPVAFDRRCPHLGCPVLWSAERGRFECPCHHAAFDGRTGAVLFGPPRRGLTPARVRPA